MPRRVLVVNAGSSSLKLRVLGGPGAASDEVTAKADLPAVGDGTGDNTGDGTGGTAIKSAVESFGPVDAVGHRIVHGGTLYAAPVLITGVGENSAEIRSRTAAGLAFLGVAVDESRNTLGKDARGDDWEISGASARVRTFVIAAREDKQIAAEVRSVLG